MNPMTETVTSVLDSQGVGASSAFGIANNSHMFNILSSGLYSDKIGAVIREVSCNAMDAHVEFGTPERPIQVKLPSALDKTFYVKDWGPGLDDAQVRQLYIIYGLSTKQLSEDQTGGFGLGCKSPFAYTLFDPENPDGFTVVAVKNGIKQVYVMHLNDAGEPAVSSLGGPMPADPDWPHGVMVSFPVQERDFAEFQAKAHEIFQWFKVKPEVIGLETPIKTPEFRFKDSEFFKFGAGRDEHVPGNYHASPAVVMANVRYPIQVDRLGNLSAPARALVKEGIHFFLPNGEVKMTPSREALQYFDKTRKNILARLEEATREMAERVRADVMTPEPSRLAWLRKVHAYASTLPFHIRSYLPDFLEAAGVSKDEVDMVRSTLRETLLPLPHWVGDGIEGRVERYQRDEQGDIKKDAAGHFLLATDQENRGCRVWRYSLDGLKIRKKEVIAGLVAVTRDKSERVTVPVLGGFHVVFADGPHADLKARGKLYELGAGGQVLLVTPCRGVHARYAREHAEDLCGLKGIDGLPCDPSSALAIPAQVLSERELRKARKLMSAAELMADEEVKFVPALGGDEITTTLGELDDEADKFYVVSRGQNYTNVRRDEVVLKLRHKYGNHTSTLLALQRLLTRCGIPFSGMVVLSAESAARRLRLDEQGYRPLLTFAMAEINRRLPEFVEGVDLTPVVPDLKVATNASRFEMMGLLTHHLLLRTPAWEMLEPELIGHPLHGALVELALKSGLGASEDPAVVELRANLSQLRRIENNGLRSVALERATPEYTVNAAFRQAYPSVGMLDFDEIKKAFSSAPEKAVKLLATVLQMDRLQEKAPAQAQPPLALAA